MSIRSNRLKNSLKNVHYSEFINNYSLKTFLTLSVKNQNNS